MFLDIWLFLWRSPWLALVLWYPWGVVPPEPAAFSVFLSGLEEISVSLVAVSVVRLLVPGHLVVGVAAVVVMASLLRRRLPLVRSAPVPAAPSENLFSPASPLRLVLATSVVTLAILVAPAYFPGQLLKL